MVIENEHTSSATGPPVSDSHWRVPWIHDCHEGAALLPTAELLIATDLANEQSSLPGGKSGGWIC